MVAVTEVYSNVIYVNVKEKPPPPPVGRIVIVSYPETVSAVQNTPFHIKFTIKNEYPDGRYVTGKIITHKGTVYKKSQPLLPGQSKEFDIFIPGDEVAEKGTFYWKIQACMDEWKVEDEKTVTVTVKPPVGRVVIVEYPETIELLTDEAVYFEVKVRNDYIDFKLVRTELIDHEGKVRRNERKIAPKTTVLIPFYHPAIGAEGTYMWKLKVTNLTDGKIEDEKTITVIVKKPEKPKYKVTIAYAGFSKPPYVSALINVGTGDSRKELPVTVETTEYLRISGIRVYTRRTYEGYVWQYESGPHPKWIYSREPYPAPETSVTKIVFKDYAVNLTCKSKKVTDTTLTILGVSSDGKITLRFTTVKYGTREVKGEILESNAEVKFRWKCPVCGHINTDIEDKDRLEALGWKVAEMCDRCGVQSYIVLM